MFFDSFVCSIRNLGRKRFRSFLTIASIAIGVASVVLIGSIGEIGKGAITDELNSLGLGSVTVSAADIAGAADVCVIDSNVAELFYKRDNVVGKSLDAMIGGSYVRLEIVGIASSGGNILQNMVGDVIPSFAYLPYTTVQRYTGEDSFGQIAVTLRDSADIDAAAEQLSASVNRFHNIERGFKAENISKQKDTLDNLLGVVTIVLSAIAAVSLVVAGLGIMTVMIVSVNERTREIGIKKSIGATRRTILLEFLIEAFTISLIGSIMGVAAGLALVWAGCALIGVAMSVNPALIAVSVALTVGIGMVFGVYPATVAARLRPVDALRTE